MQHAIDGDLYSIIRRSILSHVKRGKGWRVVKCFCFVVEIFGISVNFSFSMELTPSYTIVISTL